MTQFANRINKYVKFIVKNVSPSKKAVVIFNQKIGDGKSINLLGLPGIDEAAISASLLKGNLRYKLDVGDLIVTENTTSIEVKDKDYFNYLKSKSVMSVYSGADLPEAHIFAPGASVWYTETNSPIYSDGTSWRDANGTDISMIPLQAITSDYIIVGLGTAGAALARLLTDDMTTSVTVIEAGQNRQDDARVQQGAPLGDTTICLDPKYSYQMIADPGAITMPLMGYGVSGGAYVGRIKCSQLSYGSTW